MSHGASDCDGGCGCVAIRIITYTATGAEAQPFDVPIGTTLATADYDIFWSSAGVVNVPVLDVPTAGRTTTTFPVTTADSLSPGDVLKFLLVTE